MTTPPRKTWRLNEASLWSPLHRNSAPLHLATYVAQRVGDDFLHFVPDSDTRWLSRSLWALAIGSTVLALPSSPLPQFAVFIPLLCGALGLVIFASARRHAAFDRKRGVFQHKSAWYPDEICDLSEVAAVQLIGGQASVDPWSPDEGRAREILPLKGISPADPPRIGQEINLLLIDGHRQLVMHHNNATAARGSAEALAEFLKVPLWRRHWDGCSSEIWSFTDAPWHSGPPSVGRVRTSSRRQTY